MAIKNKNRGFALLIAVIFMSVMLSFGLALASLSYKQQVLASSAIESQYAFYAADAGLECALLVDQPKTGESLFVHQDPAPLNAPVMYCGGRQVNLSEEYDNGIISWDDERWIITQRLPLDDNKRCVDITVYKPKDTSADKYIFSEGYDVPCSVVNDPRGARFVARGINIRY